MKIINLYQETLGIVSDCCKVSKEKIISSKKEECVNARYILVSILGEWYTDNEIAELTGLSRPCTNKIRNKFKSRLKRYNVNCIPNEQYLAAFIRDYIDDPDYPTTEKAFRHFFADMMGMGKVINWKDML